jgi:hypothetical protein
VETKALFPKTSSASHLPDLGKRRVSLFYQGPYPTLPPGNSANAFFTHPTMVSTIVSTVS